MKFAFGDKIREVRERKGITMKEVARRAGLSESLISQIERNRISPALDTLLSIVDILNIDLEYLFSDYKKERNVNIVKKKERRMIVVEGTKYEQLSHTAGLGEEHSIEAYYLEIGPGGKKGSIEYGHTGHELGVIIEGDGEFEIGKKSYILYAGDSISFSSDSPHLLKNLGTGPLKAFWVVTPPKMIFGK